MTSAFSVVCNHIFDKQLCTMRCKTYFAWIKLGFVEVESSQQNLYVSNTSARFVFKSIFITWGIQYSSVYISCCSKFSTIFGIIDLYMIIIGYQIKASPGYSHFVDKSRNFIRAYLIILLNLIQFILICKVKYD